MKEIITIVRPFLAERVLESLKLATIEAIIVTEVKGFGRQKSYLDRYSQNEFALAFLPKVEISLWVEEVHLAETLKQITELARSGRMGDGKIFVVPSPGCIDIQSTDPTDVKKQLASLTAKSSPSTTKAAPRRPTENRKKGR